MFIEHRRVRVSDGEGQRRVGNQSQALAWVQIHDGQDMEPMPAHQRVRNKVHALVLVRAGLGQL